MPKKKAGPYKLKSGFILLDGTFGKEIAIGIDNYQFILRCGRKNETYHPTWESVLKEIHHFNRNNTFEASPTAYHLLEAERANLGQIDHVASILTKNMERLLEIRERHGKRKDKE